MYEEHEILPLAARTANGAGSVVKINQSLVIPPSVAGSSKFFPPSDGMPPAPPGAKFYLVVTTFSGTTPTLDVDIVKRIDDQDYVIARFAQVTETITQEVVDVSNCPNDVRVVFFLGGGTPSYTFRVHCSR